MRAHLFRLRPWRRSFVVGAILLLMGMVMLTCQRPAADCSPTRTVIAEGLTNPRGLARGPDGLLYVAEVGTKETGGRVRRIRAGGSGEVLISGLPYFVHGGTEEVGTSGLAFRRGELYVAQGEGAGDLASALLRVHGERYVPEKLADLYFFEGRYNPDDGERESNPFAVLYDDATDVFYVTDGAGNSLLRIRPSGEVELVAAWKDNRVSTGLARDRDGILYVALFSPFPYDPNSGRIDRIAADGTVQPAAANLTTPIGVAFSPDGVMHVLEFSSGFRTQPRFTFVPDSGRLLRVEGGQRSVIADRLPYPTYLLGEADGSFLISINGAFAAPGAGAVVRIEPCRRGASA